MAFNYNVTFDDPNQASDPQDGILLQALNDALSAWSTYITGVGTLNVKLSLAALGSPTGTGFFTVAEGGPTSSSASGTSGSHTIATPSSVVALTTGQHLAASDIGITFNSQLLGSITSEQSYSALSVMEHELEHGFGMVGFYNSYYDYLSGAYESPYDTNVQVQPNGLAYFTGAAAEQVYGGPVPLATAFPGSNIYHLGATGTAADPAAERNDLMYPYLVNPNATISALDVAILKDSGVPISPYGYALLYPNAAVSVATGSDGGGSTSDPLITGVANPGEVVGIFLNGNMVGSVIAAANGGFSYRPTGLGDGTYAVTASVISGSGPVSANDTLVLDTTTPINAIYQNLLGTTPTAAELAAGQQALESGTTVASLQASIAANIAALQAAYAATVNRAATPSDLARNLSELTDGATVAGERSALINSGEEQSAITSLFQNTVGRAPASGDVSRVQSDLLKGASFASERSALVASTEEGNEIQSVFQATVGRAATATDVARVRNELLNGGSIAGDRTALATGTEASNAIQAVFVNTVGRAATAGDVARLQGELSSGGSLANDRAALASSAEANAAIVNAYVAATGVGPTAPQLAASQVELQSSTTLAQITPDLLGQAAMNIIDARPPYIGVNGTAGPDLFVVGNLNYQSITNFDTARDMIELPSALASSFASTAYLVGGPQFTGTGFSALSNGGGIYIAGPGGVPVTLTHANLDFV